MISVLFLTLHAARPDTNWTNCNGAAIPTTGSL